ncbi:MAG TPA: FixH family protein [Ktedonobacteraceae bacterium]|nr:FixH family protein [Ktedonobacteraceae bacterium]
MRIRPVFWCILTFVCCALLLFAALIKIHMPAFMQVHVDRAMSVSAGYTTLELHLSDPQDIPIEQAQVIPTARMTNMPMNAISTSVKVLGQGNYRILFALSMGGPWEISIVAHADGFDDSQRALFIQIPSSITMCAEGNLHVS